MTPCYATILGVTVRRAGDDVPLCAMTPGVHVTGREGFLHGGAISGLLETAAYAAMEHALSDQTQPEIKPVNVTVEFMRNGFLVGTFASGRVLRAGSRFANVTAHAWQDDPDRPIAMAHMTFSLRR